MRGEFSFLPDGTGSNIRWTYEFKPRPGRRWIIAGPFRPLWARYMQAALNRMNAVTFATLMRGWRDRLDPADAGFPAAGRRHPPGLRREELAQIAGLSVDYVLRLEQGRATNPSAQVVAALTRALQLNRSERDQLYRAAGLLPPGRADR